jgi:hypothetical protein
VNHLSFLKYSDSASHLDENTKNKTVKILNDRLRSLEERDRRAAINGLVTLKSQSSLNAIESTRSTFADQYHPWLERRIKALSGSNNNSISTVQKDVDSLRETIKKLESKIEILEAKSKLE